VADLWADISRQLVQGADIIVGAFIGAGSAAFAAYLADRRRFKREDKYRDYADRRQAYLEFVASWQSYKRALRRAGQRSTVAAVKEMEEADYEFNMSFNALSLIAPEEVRAAASDLLHHPEELGEGEGASGRFWKAVQKDLDKWPSWWRRAFRKLRSWWRRTFWRGRGEDGA
jgi:hypothetical protein